MAKKRRTKMAFATCLKCGSNLKKKFKACTKCGSVNLARNEAAKASIGQAFTAKAASMGCPRCNVPGRLGNRFCTRCGTQLQARVVKSASEARRDRLMTEMLASPDPERRNMLYYAANPDLQQPGGAS